jgi:hypothetical protein
MKAGYKTQISGQSLPHAEMALNSKLKYEPALMNRSFTE